MPSCITSRYAGTGSKAITLQPRARLYSVYHPKLPPTSMTRPFVSLQQRNVASCQACVSMGSRISALRIRFMSSSYGLYANVNRGSVRVVTVSRVWPMGVLYRLTGLAHWRHRAHSHREHFWLMVSETGVSPGRLIRRTHEGAQLGASYVYFCTLICAAPCAAVTTRLHTSKSSNIGAGGSCSW